MSCTACCTIFSELCLMRKSRSFSPWFFYYGGVVMLLLQPFIKWLFQVSLNVSVRKWHRDCIYFWGVWVTFLKGGGFEFLWVDVTTFEIMMIHTWWYSMLQKVSEMPSEYKKYSQLPEFKSFRNCYTIAKSLCAQCQNLCSLNHCTWGWNGLGRVLKLLIHDPSEFSSILWGNFTKICLRN